MDYCVLKNLPLKVEMKNLGSKLIPDEQIAIGFIHDIIKNEYLLKSIKDEFEKSKNS